MGRCSIREAGEEKIIVDGSTNYVLRVSAKVADLGDAYFDIPSFCPVPVPSSIPVTARGTEKYSKYVINSLDIDAQYLEVGAGFSGFLMDAVANGLKKRPIVIEPMNFHSTGALLNYAKRNLTDPDELSKIENMLRRQAFFTDSSKVKLYNCTLGEALRKHGSELKEVADIVVDYCGAASYCEGEWEEGDKMNLMTLTKKVQEMEMGMLRAGGTFFMNGFPGIVKE